MPRYFSILIFQILALCSLPSAASGGAFLLPEGYGQFIAGIGFSEGTRRFDKGGRAMPTPTYRKLEASGYLEYGWRPWLSLIAAPTLASQHGAPAANSVTGSNGSAFGARLMLYGTPGRVVAVQALVQPPIGGESRASRIADGGTRSLATDLRFMVGQGFDAFGWPAFIDVAPGARVRADPLPTEARLDVTVGVRPRPNFLLLAQTFSSFAPAAGPQLDRYSYTKAQFSLVYDVSRRWSVQVGAFRTIAGRNAIREVGPLGAIWYRF